MAAGADPPRSQSWLGRRRRSAESGSAGRDLRTDRAEPSRTEPNPAEPGRTQPSRAEPSRAEPGRAEPSRTEPSRAQQGRAELSRAEPNPAGPNQTKRSRAEPNQAEPPCLTGPSPAEPPLPNRGEPHQTAESIPTAAHRTCPCGTEPIPKASNRTHPYRTEAVPSASSPSLRYRTEPCPAAPHRILGHRTAPKALHPPVPHRSPRPVPAASAPGGTMMSCAELLAVCLLSADRGPKPHRQPLPIFHDIFRRADKNDDGKLSFEEFKNYFADGILSSEELWELFSGIDRRHSDNVDTEKLCDYFSAYLGEYRNVLSALETLNAAVLAAMDKTKLRYETASKMEQFLTRFLLRETMHQLQSLQASLECAVDTVEEQAGRERKEIKKPETLVGLRSGRRCGRRGQKNICLSPADPYSGMLTTGVCVEDNSQWMAQINRLQQIIEKLECKSPRLEPLKEEAMCKGEDAHILVAKRQISVATSGIEEFRQAFRSYTEGTAGHSSCLHVSACKLTDEACFILYEFWQDVTSWRSHLQSSCSKTFQQSILSLLESPELLTTMLFPASWWIMNNN